MIARAIRVAIGAEIRGARLSAGLSQRAAAASVGMSHAQFGRIERGEIVQLQIDQLARACAAVGLRLVVRAYPDGDAVVDRAQLDLLARFRARLTPAARCGFAVEAQTRIRDVQGLTRRLALKQRDGGQHVLILLVNDTAANRRAVRDQGDIFGTQFPLDGRAVLRSISAGHRPQANGLLFL